MLQHARHIHAAPSSGGSSRQRPHPIADCSPISLVENRTHSSLPSDIQGLKYSVLILPTEVGGFVQVLSIPHILRSICNPAPRQWAGFETGVSSCTVALL